MEALHGTEFVIASCWLRDLAISDVRCPTVFIDGYIVSIINMFISMAAIDYCRRFFLSQNGTPSSLARVIHSLTLTAMLIVARAPFWSPFLAIPSAQEWHWRHDCESFPMEIILTAQIKPNSSSTISFYGVPTQSQRQGQPQKHHLYDFDISEVLASKVLQYRFPGSTTLPQALEPQIKTMFLDMSQRKSFFGCSSNFSTTTLRDHATKPEEICSDISGTYNENPYLFLSVNTTSPPRSTFARTVRREYRYKDDAPSFTVRFATADGNLTGGILLRSALTKRNEHNMLKVCSMATDSELDVLGIVFFSLSIFMEALQDYSIFINRPRVFSF